MQQDYFHTNTMRYCLSVVGNLKTYYSDRIYSLMLALIEECKRELKLGFDESREHVKLFLQFDLMAAMNIPSQIAFDYRKNILGSITRNQYSVASKISSAAHFVLFSSYSTSDWRSAGLGEDKYYLPPYL